MSLKKELVTSDGAKLVVYTGVGVIGLAISDGDKGAFVRLTVVEIIELCCNLAVAAERVRNARKEIRVGCFPVVPMRHPN
jgi:hypothetical protein